MAVDSKAKRASALSFRRLGGVTMADPDGDLTGQADRQHMLRDYRGILAGSGIVTGNWAAIAAGSLPTWIK